MKKILLRVDANAQIGWGHFYRCLALAQMLRKDFDICFAMAAPEAATLSALSEKGFEANVLPAQEYTVPDERGTQELPFDLGDQLDKINIVVLDGYWFGPAYQQELRKHPIKIAIIEDDGKGHYWADLIINHAPGILPQAYHAQPFTQFALGLEYALLRPAFLEQARKARSVDKIETLLICFGGSDFKNLTQSTLEVALEFKAFKKIIVVTGAAYQITEGFMQLVVLDHRIDHRHNLGESQMLHTMLEADLAIVPASGILYECLAARLLVISGTYTENQLKIYEGFRKLNIFFDSINFSAIHIKRIFKNIDIYSCKEVLSNQEKLLDGKSTSRFRLLFQQLSK